jgi:hydroxymethylglutaryl-CoA synthase
VPPGKFIDGLGVERMTVARSHEDPVALAATAARRLFATSGVDPATIGLCVVGTESAVDHSKPVAAYLHRLLGLPSRCRVFEAKHACFGGTAGLLAALDWIASGASRGRRALIVCTDIARYALNSAGEPTQGAGAVALVISESPRLVALEHGVTGSYSQDVNDFWRPLYSKEAVVDGHHSVQCYLDALAGAYNAWRDANLAEGLSDQLARRCYHVPYGKMAKKAHRHVCLLDGKTEAEADASYQLEVAPSLRFPSQVGNIYTGSLYLALASLLDAEAPVLEGQRIGMFSYGSGCCAEFFAGRVVSGAGALVARWKLGEPLTDRRRYTFAEYEAIRRKDEEIDRQPVGGVSHGAVGSVAFLGVDNERRIYQA